MIDFAPRVLPAGSRLTGRLEGAYYRDSFEAPLRRSDLKISDIYHAILGHIPWWGRTLLIVRNAIVSLFGLQTEPRAKVWRAEFKNNYRPGDKIIRFNLYSQDDDEIIAGRDDKHLDFRVSVMKVIESGEKKAVISTVIFVHNVYGKIYLFFVLPFHRFGLKRLLATASDQGRI